MIIHGNSRATQREKPILTSGLATSPLWARCRRVMQRGHTVDRENGSNSSKKFQGERVLVLAKVSRREPRTFWLYLPRSLSLIGCRIVDRLPYGRRNLVIHPLTFIFVVVVVVVVGETKKPLPWGPTPLTSPQPLVSPLF